MPRGDRDGSVKYVPATRDGRRIVEPEKWIIKRRYTVKGQLREKKRVAYSASESLRVKRAVDAEIERELAGAANPERVAHSFSDLVELVLENELRPAEYSGDTKIAGLRSWKQAHGHLKPLVEWFGKMPVREITYEDLDEYRLTRLKRRTVHGRTRSVASVNRELALARRLFRIARRKKWMPENPFDGGDCLIHVADEVQRMRILSFEEEERLLEACNSGKRKHLRLQIIFAIETGMRLNEQATLEFRDVDLNDRIITLRAFNSKTAQTRIIPIFDRLARELEIGLSGRVRRIGSQLMLTAKPTDLVFDDGRPRHAFENARLAADIDGLRWHDLRHTAATRMLHVYGLQAAEVMKILGHGNMKTFMRYLTFDLEMMQSLRERVDARRGAMVPPARMVTPGAELFDAGEVTEVPQ